MLHPVTKSSGLRERKRLTTQRRITDEALGLVERHGFDSVTVEEICDAADISRRTFFNYVSSKDEAVIGTFPFELDDAALDTIATTQTDNVVELVLSQLRERDQRHDPELSARRRTLLAEDPSLAHAVHTRRVERLTALAESVGKHFERFPDDRTLADVPVEVEIHAIIEMYRSALSLYLTNPHFPTDGEAPLASLRSAARIYSDLCKELAW